MHTCPNGKKYIGITCQTLNRRWLNGKGYKKNKHFINDINLYGWDNIEHTVLLSDLSKSEAVSKEIELIKFYKTKNKEYGYNITRGGQAGLTKNINQYSLNGDFIKTYDSLSDAAEKNNIDSHCHITSCARHKRKSAYGYIWRYSDDEKGISKLLNNKNMLEKRIGQYSLDGKLINTFDSLKSACDSVNKTTRNSNIKKCLEKLQKKAYGYMWAYLTTDFNENIIPYERSKILVSKLTRQKISDKLKGRKHTEETTFKIGLKIMKKINQYDLKGNLVKSHNSIKDAYKSVNAKCPTSIGKCCNGSLNKAHGYIWKFRDNPINDQDIKKANFKKKITSSRKIKVIKMSLNGEKIDEFNSITEAIESLGKNINHASKISEVCRGKRKTAYGYKWEHA